jgi:surfeit locus 1 family protein
LPTQADLPGPDTKAPARERRGLPVLPTAMVAIAVPILIGFGAWQLHRADWKAALLGDLARNADAPLLDIGTGPIPPQAQFRLVRLQLSCPGGLADLRAGRSLKGQSGYSYLMACRAGETPVTRDTGWSPRPEPLSILGGTASFEGRLVKSSGDSWTLVQTLAGPPLEPSAPPGLDTISNNHLSYAVQWFSFAAILAVIYGLWLRRWLATDRTRS